MNLGDVMIRGISQTHDRQILNDSTYIRHLAVRLLEMGSGRVVARGNCLDTSLISLLLK